MWEDYKGEILLALILYLIVINLVTFLIFGLDKALSKKGTGGSRGSSSPKRKSKIVRVPEKTLFLLSFFGGGLGGFLAMRIFRHKTQKKAFIFGIPLLLLVNIAATLFILFKTGSISLGL